MSNYAESVLAGISLYELREVARLVEQQLYDRRCQSYLKGVGSCTAEPPHEEGWHECGVGGDASASPAHSATPVRVVVRWRFADDVVDQERAHEERRRPGAN